MVEYWKQTKNPKVKTNNSGKTNWLLGAQRGSGRSLNAFRCVLSGTGTASNRIKRECVFHRDAIMRILQRPFLLICVCSEWKTKPAGLMNSVWSSVNTVRRSFSSFYLLLCTLVSHQQHHLSSCFSSYLLLTVEVSHTRACSGLIIIHCQGEVSKVILKCDFILMLWLRQRLW